MLHGLTPADVVQPSLPGMGSEADPNKDRLMKAVDALNHKLGRDAVRLASTGFEREWKGKSELQSGASLTDPERLPKAKDGPKPRIRFHE
jgi:DNA polymerase V